ncbi:cbb3-type cytochrome c oxidase N-terminal domain-containing protein [Campylobacter californiensis]|uniref:cbb3-type cytochrome c oxidase N-terminal domain-containing protein n=1 Tax=Campylobacter californiensis TaxID=1032243 RepID=UPI0014756E68|nr:cbb3-type cytochrome c oxidase N-terminal domain-containing protein [Campylobacter sp. RM12916]MBE3609547.1 c-type cytochrome [Campylobacter sp. RM12916]
MEWFNLEDNINLLSLIGALAIIVLTVFVAGKYIKQMREEKDANAELSEHVCDGIGEYKNPVPIGWAVMFVLTLVWAIWYFLAGYPLNSYSQIGEYNQEVKTLNEKFKQEHANLDTNTLKDMGSGIYLVQCSACHGITGDGISGKAADLSVWGSEEGIYEAIVKGSKGLGYPGGDMPAGLGGDEANSKAIAAYVAKEISGIKSSKNENLVAQGKELYVSCAACHGDDGKGMDGVFPDLTKYGTSEFVVEVLNKGKKGDIGEMPKFDDSRLNEIQQKAVGEYILSLSRGK